MGGGGVHTGRGPASLHADRRDSGPGRGRRPAGLSPHLPGLAEETPRAQAPARSGPQPVSTPEAGRGPRRAGREKRRAAGRYLPGAHGEASSAAPGRPQAGGGAGPGLQRGGAGGSAASCPAAT